MNNVHSLKISPQLQITHFLNYANIRLSESEYRQLSGNLDEIIDVHNRLQLSLEEGEKAATSTAPPTRQQTPNNQLRVGRILLSNGALIKSAHTTYWANHPKAVCIFEKYRDSLDTFMEGKLTVCHKSYLND